MSGALYMQQSFIRSEERTSAQTLVAALLSLLAPGMGELYLGFYSLAAALAVLRNLILSMIPLFPFLYEGNPFLSQLSLLTMALLLTIISPLLSAFHAYRKGRLKRKWNAPAMLMLFTAISLLTTLLPVAAFFSLSRITVVSTNSVQRIGIAVGPRQGILIGAMAQFQQDGTLHTGRVIAEGPSRIYFNGTRLEINSIQAPLSLPLFSDELLMDTRGQEDIMIATIQDRRFPFSVSRQENEQQWQLEQDTLLLRTREGWETIPEEALLSRLDGMLIQPDRDNPLPFQLFFRKTAPSVNETR